MIVETSAFTPRCTPAESFVQNLHGRLSRSRQERPVHSLKSQTDCLAAGDRLSLTIGIIVAELLKQVLLAEHGRMSATTSFGIQRVDRKDFQVPSVSGYMGNSECAKLEYQMEQLFEQEHRQVILDFAALTFVTSASLSRLAKQTRWFEREGGTIQL